MDATLGFGPASRWGQQAPIAAVRFNWRPFTTLTAALHAVPWSLAKNQQHGTSARLFVGLGCL